MPIILKGILHPDDAKLAVVHGAKAVIVSNHGARQLDGVPASIDALPGTKKERKNMKKLQLHVDPHKSCTECFVDLVSYDSFV